MGKEVRFLSSVKNSDGSYNVKYGVDDFNKMVSCLIGSGVAPFPSKDTYTTDELNMMTESVISSGASLGGLKASLAENVISIAQGIGFFSNGATIEVDSEGVTLDYTAADMVYVYAAYDANLNICDFYARDTEPAETDNYFIIKLAQISIEGKVTDVRSFAVSKVGTLGRNVPVVIDMYDGDAGVAGYISPGGSIILHDFDISRFNVVHIKGTPYSDYADSIDYYGIHNSSYVFDSAIPLEYLYSGGTVTIYNWSPNSNSRYVLYVRCRNGKVELYCPTAAEHSKSSAFSFYKLRVGFY